MTNPMLANTAGMDKAVLRRYLELPQPDDKVMATYIWIDGTGENLRGR
jgi:glutamine synthetase